MWGPSRVLRHEVNCNFSTYIRHTTRDGADKLSRDLTCASELSPFIFVGLDSNGHYPLWGPMGSKVDKIGEMVEGMLCGWGLLVLNSQCSPPTFCSDKGQQTWIDVSAASPALVPSVSEWAVWDHVEALSDHRLIVTQMLT